MPRIHCSTPLVSGASIDLPSGAARHIQVLRMQPGDAVTLFDGRGGEFTASVTQMGRSAVQVLVGLHDAVERELARPVHLVVGMPANDRMDWLVEKATELGVASIQPVTTERSVLRLSGDRADKKVAHWQAVAVAACEQSGRNRVPALLPIQDWARWLRQLATTAGTSRRLLLSLGAHAEPLAQAIGRAGELVLLSGPEGGLSAAEEAAAGAHGFHCVTLGARVLRAETAPLAVLAALSLMEWTA